MQRSTLVPVAGTIAAAALLAFLRRTRRARTVPCVDDSALLPNRRCVLRRRPGERLEKSDLEVEDGPEVSPAQLRDGEVLVRVETLSVDAFIRTTLDEDAYHGSTDIGAVVPALGVGVVLASRSRHFCPGQRVTGMLGAQTHAVVAEALVARAPALPGLPHDVALAETGLTTGLTAAVGIGCVLPPPRAGEVVAVSAASGAVGTCACQLAARRGAKVIAISRASKEAYLRDTALASAVADHTGGPAALRAALDVAAPDGIDFFFDSVGGDVLDAVLERLRPGGRVVLCGAVSQYDSGSVNRPGAVQGPRSYLKLAERGATMAGFNVMHHARRLPWVALRAAWAAWRGHLRVPRHVDEGIDAFPAALHGLLAGSHCGKRLVRVIPPPGGLA